VNPVTLRLAANSVFTRFSANFYDQVKIIMFDCQFRHLEKFAGGVDVQYWNVILSKKDLRASQITTLESFPIDHGMAMFLKA